MNEFFSLFLRDSVCFFDQLCLLISVRFSLFYSFAFNLSWIVFSFYFCRYVYTFITPTWQTQSFSSWFPTRSRLRRLSKISDVLWVFVYWPVYTTRLRIDIIVFFVLSVFRCCTENKQKSSNKNLFSRSNKYFNRKNVTSWHFLKNFFSSLQI